MKSDFIDAIRQAYGEYLEVLSKKNFETRYKNKEEWFSASKAGHCILKHKFQIEGVERDPIDQKSLIVMRIGDLIHNDIQESLRQKYEDKILLEHEIIIKDLNVRGFLDIAVLSEDKSKVTALIDIKTIKSYAYKKRFGRAQNRDPNPSRKYEYQIGTYALGLAEQGYDIDNLKILYYRKDDSQMKEVDVPKEYMSVAKKYWEDVLSIIEDKKSNIRPGEFYMAPMENWECKYGCPWASKCDSPYKEEA